MTRELAITQPFDLELSLTMGQAFRWRRLGDGWLSGVLGENLFHIRQRHINGNVEYRVGGADGERDATDADDQLLRRYFREDDDVTAIYDDISHDPVVAGLVRQFPGMRVLRQEPWECVAAYICSANNNIDQISRIVEKIADTFGETVELAGEARRTFPLAERLLSDSAVVEKAHQLKLGLQRAPNIISAAGRVCEGEMDLDTLARRPYTDAKAELMKCSGVGNKIADCIALFSLDKLDAFPVDLHIGRALAKQYDCPMPGGNRKSLNDSDHKRLISWAQNYFGKYAGYAGQYLFHAQRDEQKRGNDKNLLSGAPKRSKFVGTSVDDPRHRPLLRKYVPETLPEFEDHRVSPCPRCEAPIGRHCKYPSGYTYTAGHKARLR